MLNFLAVDMFMQALELFTKLLDDHFMTAQCLKDIADFLFFVDKTDSNLVEPLSTERPWKLWKNWESITKRRAG